MKGRSLRFIQITDTHLCDRADGLLRGVNTAATLAAVVAQIRAREPHIDGVLATGDLSHDGGTPSYRRLITLLRPLRAPIYCLPGNHDALSSFACLLKAAQTQSGGRLLKDRWQLIFLDSAVPGAVHGHLRPAELARLHTALSDQRDRHALICLHHQPVQVGSAWIDRSMLDNADAFFDIVDRHINVRGVLWGHVHQVFDAERNGVRLLATPSTCVQFKPGCTDFTLDDEAPPAYRWLELHDDGSIATAVESIFIPPCSDESGAG